MRGGDRVRRRPARDRGHRSGRDRLTAERQPPGELVRCIREVRAGGAPISPSIARRCSRACARRRGQRRPMRRGSAASQLTDAKRKSCAWSQRPELRRGRGGARHLRAHGGRAREEDLPQAVGAFRAKRFRGNQLGRSSSRCLARGDHEARLRRRPGARLPVRRGARRRARGHAASRSGFRVLARHFEPAAGPVLAACHPAQPMEGRFAGRQRHGLVSRHVSRRAAGSEPGWCTCRDCARAGRST